jgi:hypothetical protein
MIRPVIPRVQRSQRAKEAKQAENHPPNRTIQALNCADHGLIFPDQNLIRPD